MAAIQARGVLVAFDGNDGPAIAASENAADCLREDPMGRPVRDVLGQDAEHALRNLCALPWIGERPVFAGRYVIGEAELDLHVHVSEGSVVAELEPSDGGALPDAHAVARDVELIARELRNGPRSAVEDVLRTLSGFRDVSVGDTLGPLSRLVGAIGGEGLSCFDDMARDAVQVTGDAPDLTVAHLRSLPPDAMETLVKDGIRAITILGQGEVVLTHPRPRMPSHRTRLVLMHLTALLRT